MITPLLKILTSSFTDACDAINEIFYPGLCICCESRTTHHSELFCTSCQCRVSQTNQHLTMHNLFTDHFKGKFDLVCGSALFYFVKDGPVQQLIHLIKYHNRPDIALALGHAYGAMLKCFFPYNTIDLVVPVPLHRSKKNKRGYNQAAVFSKGISEQLNVPVCENALHRLEASHSQTEKTRWERFENVSKVFVANGKLSIHGKHVLLVDDVLTTGATLEACARALFKWYNIRISMVTMAMALKN